jgi:prepilin-type N-terminal cleavage/methylation domain-containing protein/prepilin-type processing-associated H-X9-DG protein
MLDMRSLKSRIEVQSVKRRGFTLVELLIVVAIIALLVAMLLPALTKARRAANQVACMSNMRQIVMAVLTYTMDNRGRLMPALIYPIGKNQPYPDGFFWAAELVHQNYLQAPNLPHSPTIPNNALAPQPDAGVFDCPDAIRPGEWDADANGLNNNGTYPTDPRNNGWCYMIDDNPRNDGQPAYGTATYYELNCRLNGYTSNYNNGTFNPPFMYFASGTDKLGQTEAQAIANQQYSRVLSMVQHADTLVLLGEAANINWNTQTPSVVNGITHYAPRLGARHGSYSANRTNAYTNFAFFDGHVASVPTQPIDQNNGSLISPAVDGMSAMTQSSGTVFTLALDHN